MNDSPLSHVWTVWDEAVEDFDTFCRPGCAVCCTDQVCVTTAEGRLILDHLSRSDRPDLIRAVKAALAGFAPAATTNQIAEACLARTEPPDEPPRPDPGVCLFLENGLCAIYEARPLACRVQLSRTRCAPGSEADMRPLWITVAGVFWQWVEHLDAGGRFGNLTRVLQWLENAPGAPTDLLTCRPAPALMVPPEDQPRVAPILARLQQGPAR